MPDENPDLRHYLSDKALRLKPGQSMLGTYLLKPKTGRVAPCLLPSLEKRTGNLRAAGILMIRQIAEDELLHDSRSRISTVCSRIVKTVFNHVP